jgi:hypothetical protein
MTAGQAKRVVLLDAAEDGRARSDDLKQERAETLCAARARAA